MQWRKIIQRTAVLSGAAVLAFAPAVPLQASEQGEGVSVEMPVAEIHTYEDLLQIAENPAGSYKLMDNINMEGLPWEPVDFSGIFDGNGYTLLNLEVNGIGKGVEDTYDGNYKVYDTYFAGLFGTPKGAEVTDLNLLNVKIRVETDKPCFIGSIAGYSEGSTVRGCHIQGRLELSAFDRMFGVGGIIGYGSGLIEQTDADVTLICTDTDRATRDEQFLGGAYAAGYIDLNECNVKIDGYDSDHGYVHNGGLVGMYILYPKGLKYKGYITNNTVSGKITFFEDNKDRRAYCKEIVGEIMNWTFTNKGNKADFKRDEIFDYSVDLRPDMCVDAVHTETVTEPGCNTFGYTTVTCGSCGYSYTDHYTPYRHTAAEWIVVKKPTVQDVGFKMGACQVCRTLLTEEIERLEPPEEAPEKDAAGVGENLAAGAPDVAGTPGDTAPSGSQAGIGGDGVGKPDATPETGAAGATGGEAQKGDMQEQERDVMEIFKNPVVIGVIVVLVLALAVGEMIVFKDRKRR